MLQPMDREPAPRTKFTHSRALSDGMTALDVSSMESPAANIQRAAEIHIPSAAFLHAAKYRQLPFTIRICAALASIWFFIKIITLYPSLFLMFCYPVLLAAVLEPMKTALWKCLWYLSIRALTLLTRYAKRLLNGKPMYPQDQEEERQRAQSTDEQELRYAQPTALGSEVSSQSEDTLKERMVGASRRVHDLDTDLEENGPGGDLATAAICDTAKAYAEDIWKKVLLAVAIALCLMTAGRVVIILCKIVLVSAEQICSDFPHYQHGAEHRVKYLKDWIASMTEARLGKRLEVPVNILIVTEQQFLQYLQKAALKASTYVVQEMLPQTCITTLFLVFLMWNPVKSQGSRKDVLDLCSDYVKVKSGLSTLLGFLVGTSLMMCGLELYYAAGLLVAFANFIPNGALLCSTFPCIFGLLDDRKHIQQVMAALIIQLFLINGFAFIIEPLFFGAAIEMHPIPAILGVTFFGYVWGVPGMLISIPLLGAFRLALAAWASKASSEEKPAIEALQGFIEGRWTAAAELTLYESEEMNMHTQGYAGPGPSQSESNSRNPNSNWPLPKSVTKISIWLHHKYREHAILTDGCMYALLIYFLFSVWSDHVFGIYGSPPSSAYWNTPPPFAMSMGNTIMNRTNSTML